MVRKGWLKPEEELLGLAEAYQILFESGGERNTKIVSWRMRTIGQHHARQMEEILSNDFPMPMARALRICMSRWGKVEVQRKPTVTPRAHHSLTEKIQVSNALEAAQWCQS